MGESSSDRTGVNGVASVSPYRVAGAHIGQRLAPDLRIAVSELDFSGEVLSVDD